MKVKELIDKLSRFDPDLEIQVAPSPYSWGEPIHSVKLTAYHSKDDSPKVVISLDLEYESAYNK